MANISLVEKNVAEEFYNQCPNEEEDLANRVKKSRRMLIRRSIKWKRMMIYYPRRKVLLFSCEFCSTYHVVKYYVSDLWTMPKSKKNNTKKSIMYLWKQNMLQAGKKIAVSFIWGTELLEQRNCHFSCFPFLKLYSKWRVSFSICGSALLVSWKKCLQLLGFHFFLVHAAPEVMGTHFLRKANCRTRNIFKHVLLGDFKIRRMWT